MTTSVHAVSSPATTAAAPRQGLTLRSFVICLFALLLMGIWIEYEELYNFYGGPLAENSPPNSAIGVILLLLLISSLLYAIRRSLRLSGPELVFILAALLVAAPLMSQGMWHRIFGLMASIPHNEDFKSYESLPSMLWPHGRNLTGGPFAQRDDLGAFRFAGSGTLGWEEIAWRGYTVAPRLEHGPRDGVSYLELPLDAAQYGLVPGENYLFSCLIKTDQFQSNSAYFVRLQADDGPESTVLMNSAPTSPTFALQQGFARIGKCPVKIPLDMQKRLTLRIGISGPGALTVQDVQWFSSQAVEGAYTGVKVARKENYDKLGAYERDFTLRKPDSLFSLQGLGYLLKGFIPLEQWATPMLAWAALVCILFMGFMGFNVLLRKQWTDSERFSFPMNIVPRQLFTEELDAKGRPYLPIFRNRVFWVGFALAMTIALLKGLHFYFPGVPAPSWSNMWAGAIRLDQFVSNPLLKAFFQNSTVALVFSLFAIALLVETDILFSIWASFMLFQFMYMFGKAFNLNKYAGYPWDWSQAVGAFIGYAGLALVMARRHLVRIARHLLGKEPMDDREEMVSYRTAFWMILASLGLLVLWGLWTSMGAWASLLFFSFMLIIGLAASKIRAEAGMPFAYWIPYQGMLFVMAVGGFAVFGSSGVLVATMASGFMSVACFFFIAPIQVEMMELGRQFNMRLKDIGVGLWMGLLGGIFIGGFVLLCWAYGFGADNLATDWPYGQNWYFTNYRQGELAIDRAFATDPQNLLTPATSLNFVQNVDAKGIGIGVLVTGALAWLRGAFTWFPLHPLGYVLACTHFARVLWFTCFVAWAVRLIVLRIGGAHSIRQGLIPFSVGMFIACVVSVILFAIVGFVLRGMGITHIYSQLP